MLAANIQPSAHVPARLVSLLLLVALGAVAANLTWQLLEPDVRPAPTGAVANVGAVGPPRTGPDSPFLAVSDIPLFGNLGARTAPPAPVAAPETRLRLRLLGLAAGDTPHSGRAIIAEGSGAERLYAVGDALGGGQARLHAVMFDHVILERAGQMETLRLPRPEGGAEGGGSSLSPPASLPATPVLSGNEPRVQRSEWLENPDRLMQSIRARPVTREGALHGLEVRPTRNARQFQEAGLQPGDIITSVGGIPLAAIDDPMALFARLAQENQVDLTIERRGQAIPLSVQLY